MCLRIFFYKETEIKIGSVCRADRGQSNGSTIRSLGSFHIELEQFCCSLTAAYSKHEYEHRAFEINSGSRK